MLRTGVILADRYQLDEPIAAGGVGQVWRATDLILQRPVAVKLLRPEYADHPETLSRFRAEARHAGSLAHPGIAQVYDFGDNPLEGPPYLVMELVDGPSLADVLATEPITPPYALEVLAKAAVGLAAAHEAGLVHRDIKPGNILLGRDGQVKITDFGIAHAIGSAPVTDPGLVMGTTQYLAPERIAGGSGTPAADLYSLGIVMHECLTGKPPYEGTPAEVMAGHLYVPLPPLPAGTPSQVEELVSRLTAKDPEQRICDASELAALARAVRADISGGPMPRQRQASAISPAGGVAAPSDLVNPNSDPGGPVPGGAVLGDADPGGLPARSGFPEAPVAPAGLAAGGVSPGMEMAHEEGPYSEGAFGEGPYSEASFGEAPLPEAAFADVVSTGGPTVAVAPPWQNEAPADGPGTELALRDPGAGGGTVAIRGAAPARGTGPMGDLGPVQETSVDLAAVTSVDLAAVTSVDLAGGPADSGPRIVDGTLADEGTGPFATEQAFTGGHARPRLAGMRDTGPLQTAGRPRRRRAAIGVGVLLLAGGAGLTGAVASGALHTSPMADRTNPNAARQGLSAVQPNAGANSLHGPAAGKGARAGKHARSYAPKHSKAATQAPAPATSSAPAPASSAPATPSPRSTRKATKPTPSPSSTQPPGLLKGLLGL